MKKENQIEKIRQEIKEALSSNSFIKSDSESYGAPSGNYRMETHNYWLEGVGWDLTKVEIYDNVSGKKLFDFFGNDGQFFHEWLTKNDREYLICAEDLFGGQTVVDLTERRMESYTTGEDGFIWTDFHLSPDGNTLATIGCYWACPYVIKIYDFKDPLSLPLKELKEIELLDNDEVITGWKDNHTLTTKGVKREREIEKFEGGSQRMKVISETPIEREINVKHIT
jgi:hypothetical protein